MPRSGISQRHNFFSVPHQLTHPRRAPKVLGSKNACHWSFNFKISLFDLSNMTDNVPATSDSSSRGRGGRRRGRGGGAGQPNATPNTGGAANRGSKPRGRGGKGSGGRDKQKSSEDAEDAKATTTPATATVGSKTLPAATDDADDGEVCFICASTVEHTSVSPCNHRTCHICALRLRALYKNKGCAHCRVSGSSPRSYQMPIDHEQV